MKPNLQAAAVGLIGLVAIAALATWLVVHILIKVALLILLAVGTVWLARSLSRPHPEIFGPSDTEGEKR